jgi:hypothetical protein
VYAIGWNIEEEACYGGGMVFKGILGLLVMEELSGMNH